MKTIRDNQGIAMVVVIMTMVVLLAITGAGLLLSGLNLKTSSNLKTGSAAFHAADGGIQHALAAIPQSSDFDSLLQGFVAVFPLVGGKPTLSGSLSAYNYTVVAENDITVPGETTTDDVNGVATLSSTATGSDGTTRRVRAYIEVDPLFSNIRGAVGMRDGTDASRPTEIEDMEPASGSSIDGNDCNPPAVGGGSGPGPALPGIATESANGKTEVDTDLSNAGATTAVTGVNGSGDVTTVSGWMSQTDFNAWVNSLISQSTPAGTGACGGSNPGEFGTWANPQICQAQTGPGVTLDSLIPNGSTGAGILIVNDLDPNALADTSAVRDFTYEGVVIVVGDGRFRLRGNSNIYGAVIQDNVDGSHSGETRLRLRDDSSVCYSSLATGLMTPPVNLIAWHEVM